MSSDKDWTYQIQKDITQFVFNTFECWSLKCPNFIHFNESNFTFWTSAQETNVDKVNGTYLYYIEMEDVTTKVLTRKTYTLKMEKASIKSVGISINLPFDIWYALHKNSI